MKIQTVYRKKIFLLTLVCILALLVLWIRVVYLMVWKSQYYSGKAEDLHQRERTIAAKRGRILDRNGVVLADNQTVCTISVIHNQIKEPEKVISLLSKELQLPIDQVRKRVEKVSSIEKVKGNVPEEIGKRIKASGLSGIKVDEGYKRYYPYGELASKVLGFTGGDYQGIIGLEVKYDSILAGTPGVLYTTTDARGVELENYGESRKEPVSGQDLYTTLDYTIQMYATQLAKQAMESKQAAQVAILVMNPQNGEIYACVDVPEFDCNAPFTLPESVQASIGENPSEKSRQNALNTMWRNHCINDTYEPGSTFKIITAAAGLEEGVVQVSDTFSCPGFIIVGDRKIRCHKIQGHGIETFAQGIQNSCNPVFITVGQRLGVDKYYTYFEKYRLQEKTGIDLPGEASTIMHKKEAMGPVELATVSFGQSFQITPIQLATTVSSIINGGKRNVPHLGLGVLEEENLKRFSFPCKSNILSPEVSHLMGELLTQVVEQGGGINAKVEGYTVGGKTATSQMLPRGSGKYISSFLGFSPTENPQVMALAIVYEPKGIYYGSQVAAPIVRQLFENILPYLDRMCYNK